MRKKWLALAGTALALVLVAGTFNTAEAHRRGGFHGGGAKFYGGGHRFVGPRYFAHRHHHHHHRHFRRGIIIGAPLVYGGYYYGYGGCRWLRIRAIETGSGYWWARYDDCLRGYY